MLLTTAATPRSSHAQLLSSISWESDPHCVIILNSSVCS